MNDFRSEVPPGVKAFIADYLGSVVQLETLLLLHAAPDRQWTADDVAADLRINRDWADAQLRILCEEKLAECTEAPAPRRYRFDPATAELRSAIAALAREYAERRVTVISLIFAKPPDTLRAFSDAFRLRKDHSDHG